MHHKVVPVYVPHFVGTLGGLAQNPDLRDTCGMVMCLERVGTRTAVIGVRFRLFIRVGNAFNYGVQCCVHIVQQHNQKCSAECGSLYCAVYVGLFQATHTALYKALIDIGVVISFFCEVVLRQGVFSNLISVLFPLALLPCFFPGFLGM